MVSLIESSPSKKRRAIIADLPAGITVHKLGNGYFRVRLGKKFTGGIADRRDFAKLEGGLGARKWIDDQVRDRSAIRAMELTPDQLAQAKQAFLRLGDTPLDVAVDYFFTSGPGSRKAMRLEEAKELYRTHHDKATSAPDYVYAQTISINLLIQGMGNRELSYVTAERLDKWFDATKKERKWGEINTLNYIRDLKMFFRFCVGRNLIPRNPFDDHIFVWVKALRKRIKREGGVIEVYTLEECNKLLVAAMENPKLDMLPWLVVALFTGIRVDELEKMTWDRFRWDDKEMSIPQEIAAKGGHARHIEFSEAFSAWISKVPGVQERAGLVRDKKNWRHRLDELHKLAGVDKKRNGLRHTMASMHYVHYRNAQETRRLLGQETKQVLFDHYVSLIPRKDAKAFWALRPAA